MRMIPSQALLNYLGEIRFSLEKFSQKQAVFGDLSIVIGKRYGQADCTDGKRILSRISRKKFQFNPLTFS